MRERQFQWKYTILYGYAFPIFFFYLHQISGADDRSSPLNKIIFVSLRCLNNSHIIKGNEFFISFARTNERSKKKSIVFLNIL